MSEIKQSADSEMMREQFEKWFIAQRSTIPPEWNVEGREYANPFIQEMWLAWQKSSQQTAARCAEIAKEASDDLVAWRIRAEFEVKE